MGVSWTAEWVTTAIVGAVLFAGIMVVFDRVAVVLVRRWLGGK